MNLKSIIPWAILLGVIHLFVNVLGPYNDDFVRIAPGSFVIGALILSIRQIYLYNRERKESHQRIKNIKTAI